MFQSLYFAAALVTMGVSAMTTPRRWEIPSTRDFVERGRTLSARVTVLSDGHTMAYGALTKSQKWQSSGSVFPCPLDTPSNGLYDADPLTFRLLNLRFLQKNGGGNFATTNINNYFTIKLTSDPKSELDPGGRTPRQRVEFLNAHSPGKLLPK